MAPENIQLRARRYAVRAINVFRHLQEKKDRAGWIVAGQFLRAATSVGANLVEAESGESRADFIHKCGIAQKEARESKYWLLLIRDAELVPQQKVTAMLQETEEIIAVITSIIVSAKRNDKSR